MPQMKWKALPNGEIVDLATKKHYIVVSHTLANHGHGKNNILWVDLGNGNNLKIARKWLDESEHSFSPGAVNTEPPRAKSAEATPAEGSRAPATRAPKLGRRKIRQGMRAKVELSASDPKAETITLAEAAHIVVTHLDGLSLQAGAGASIIRRIILNETAVGA